MNENLESKHRSSAKFYGENASDNEKVVLCSIISSSRQEGEDVLSNS
jgi:hypothetical protein